MKKIVNIIGISCFLLLLATSCGPKQHIYVSQDRLVFDLSGGTMSFSITADCDWTIEKDATDTWVSLSQLQGNKKTTIQVTVDHNTEGNERSTTINIVSDDKKVNKKVYIQQKASVFSNYILGNIWFLRFYERWDLDYNNQVIDASYRSRTYYTDDEFENWFFYFTDTIGYLIYRTSDDTIYYPYHYHYYPEKDSLYLNFVTQSSTEVEDYYARIFELSHKRFTFSNEYRHHQFEKLYTVNVTNKQKGSIRINPKNIKNKPHGPLIPAE